MGNKKICGWCRQELLKEQLKVKDEYGDEMHLFCAVEEGDSQIIDNEHG